MLEGVGYAGCVGTGNFGMYGLTPTPINPDQLDPLGLSNPMVNPGNPSYLSPAPVAPLPVNPMLGTPSTITPLSAPSLLDPSPLQGTPPEKMTPIVPELKSNSTAIPRVNEKVTTVALESRDLLSGSIVIKLPARAKLYVDGSLVKSDNTAERYFHSPALEPGAVYYYMVKVEVMKDDKCVTEEQKVRVRAGETTKISFDHLKSKDEKDTTSIVEAK